jgi:hypothetical protein
MSLRCELYIYRGSYQFEQFLKHRAFLNKIYAFTALRFTATGAPPAAKRTRILPLTQHADNFWNEEVLTFVHRSQEVLKRSPSTRKHLSQLILKKKHMYRNPSCT